MYGGAHNFSIKAYKAFLDFFRFDWISLYSNNKTTKLIVAKNVMSVYTFYSHYSTCQLTDSYNKVRSVDFFWDSEQLNDLPKITQLQRGRIWILT